MQRNRGKQYNGMTRVLFKKIRNTKGTFHAKMGSIKDRNGMHLTEAEEIKKRWQDYTEELYKKDLHDPDNHDGIITQQYLLITGKFLRSFTLCLLFLCQEYLL